MKILLIRFSSIGDIVLTSPVIRCVRTKWPDAEIHYLTKPAFASLLQHHPAIDRIHLLKEPIVDSRKALIQEGFDLVIDLHKNLRSRYIKRGLNAKSVSFDKLNIQKFLFTQWKIDRLPKRHLVDRYFDGLRKLGVKNDGKGLDMYLPPQAVQAPSRLQLETGYVVYAIGGTYPTKRLPNDRIAELISLEDRPVVLLGGPDDLRNEQAILQLAPNANVRGLSGQLNLLESAGVIRQARHVYCHDSGMMHIAAAFHRPMSVIWGNTHAALGMYAYGYGPDEPLFEHEVDLSCRPCSKLGHERCPKGHFNCMQLQNVEDIVKKSHSVEQAQ